MANVAVVAVVGAVVADGAAAALAAPRREATTALESSARPVRRCAHDRNGITSSEASASPMPTGEDSGSWLLTRARTDSKKT